MPHWDKDGGRVITTLFEAAAFKRAVSVTCPCGRRALLNPYSLWWHFHRRGDEHRLAKIGNRFRCLGCGQRGGMKIEATLDDWERGTLPMPPEGEWKRAVNRFRN